MTTTSIKMYSKPKKSSLLILGITSLVFSRIVFFLFNDPEGPNPVVITGLAAILWSLSLLTYFLKSPSATLNWLLLAITVQIIIAACLWSLLR